MDTFLQRKAAALAELSSSAPDKSPKGGVDAPIIPLLDHLNAHPYFFTTSSCSGRISILLTNPNEASKAKKKAGGGRWLFVSHEKADPEVIIGLLFGDAKEEDNGFEAALRFEPMILAVDCRDLESARQLVSLAVSSGFRESGITSIQKRVIIAIRCSIRMEVPLGRIGNLPVSPDYIKYLINIANNKMEANKQRTDGFFISLQSKLLQTGTISPVPNLDNDENVKLEDSLCEEESQKTDDNKRLISDSSEVKQNNSLSTSILTLTGEPIEKLFLWGQSACAYNNNNNNQKSKQIIIFGGFGGIGRHSRQNYSLIIEAELGALNALNAVGPPCQRMGHTISLVGEDLYVIGGRAGPNEILNDVWVLVKNDNTWVQLDCTGDFFKPRHRHAAATIGSKIYVFGGINNEEIYSCMNILNTQTLQWEEIKIKIKEECPSPRHSHTMVAHKSNLFLFGGHNGNKPLGDFYSFDTKTLIWKKEITKGNPPFARFSHSMFVYNNYIGVLGGCPFRQQEHQEMALLELSEKIWTNLKIDSVGKNNMWVRSSVIVINDELFIIGGGASCYAFGTKFNPPMKINLNFLIKDCGDLNLNLNNFVFRVEKKIAKETKDLLKKFVYLDLNRKVKVTQNGCQVIFPVNRVFCDLFTSEGLDCKMDGRTELQKLISCGGVLENDESSVNKKGFKSPQILMRELIKPLLENNEISLDLLDQIPTRWEQLGDMVILPKTCFKDPFWDSISDQLWPLVAKSLGTQRLARQGRILPTGTRDSTLELLVGSDGWVTHHENGIFYSLDTTKCMFSWGNRSEKIRIGSLNCTNEIVVDLFAGIGYFTLPFLVKAKAKLVYACEWNPNALIALRRNINDNFVSDRCIILEGDNNLTAPKGVADRVCLGLLPSSECSWVTAVKALRREGGTLHIHGNVNDSEEESWLDNVVESITHISLNEGLCWDVSIQHVERVKWYGPHIRHLVADVRCKQI